MINRDLRPAHASGGYLHSEECSFVATEHDCPFDGVPGGEASEWVPGTRLIEGEVVGEEASAQREPDLTGLRSDANVGKD